MSYAEAGCREHSAYCTNQSSDSGKNATKGEVVNMTQPSPQVYYEVLTTLLLDLFGHDWHLGYWLNAANPAEAAQRLNEIMVNRLPVKEGMTVLDIGCGVGGPACFIAEKTRCHV